MRISTLTMYEQSTSSLNRQQSAFLKVGQQVASTKRVLNPSDDPLAMSKASNISQSKSLNEQFANARVAAKNSLGQEESVLNSVSDAIASIKTLLVQASTGTLSDPDRDSVASEIEGIYKTLIGQANATDGNGRYLFGGYRDNAPPFVEDAAGRVTYVGDSGSPKLQVDSSRQMPASDNGRTVFLSVIGSAEMVARADAANAGTVKIANPTVEDSSAAGYRNPFTIEFSDVAGVAHYSINGGAAAPFVSGDKIVHNGVGIALTGVPVSGDSITVSAGGGGDLFASVKDVIDVLRTNADTPEKEAALRNALNTSMNELTSSQDNVLTVRASVGARLNEVDVIDTVGENRALNYEASISSLLDLDMNKALSEYAMRQIGLQAAQKSFVDVQRMSLFNYIK